MYKLLHKLPAETAHQAAICAMKKKLSPKIEVPEKPVEVFGLKFKNPIGMAAGFDKNAECIESLFNLGFGFVEVGTVTPRAQTGNPKPRLFRLSEDEAIINRLGFNNKGIEVFLDNVSKAKRNGILGINIGANKDSEKFEEDYAMLIGKVSEYADYITANISSPNTPGLRLLQKEKAISSLVQRIKKARDSQLKRPPLLVKIAPDLEKDDIESIVDVLVSEGVNGVIATNTTIARPELKSKFKGEQGGLSGRPVFEKSNEVIRIIAKKAGDDLPIIGVGGVFSAEDAKAKFDAGAKLVQLYTGLIYKGPEIVKEILEGI